ncbi:NifU family protein [Aureispira anguillae]|uniref:NifU family protein n=1 Tax=Aureispira anguillae TaxID=2864201 RepID=A0A915YGM5_9BACT|nr:NifU family protein [Aureispira anguillae]BDS12664.1 NifU family protein [Aureispira anguillae]
MSLEKEKILQRVEQALTTLRPHLETDGGDIEIVELTDDMVLRFRWLGNCETCSMSTMTMKGGVEHTVKSFVPEIKAVEAVNGLFFSMED